ncbi:MAG: multiheme c-type cytochrome, partial [candidate division Zixibacteria bacterium]
AVSRFGFGTLAWTVLTIAAVFLMNYAYVPMSFNNEFPDGYSYDTELGPFRPSLAKTSTGGAFDPRSLAHSDQCGQSGCHLEIYNEWLPSSHRYASMDPAFQAVQGTTAANNGPRSTRYCAGCHDPIALFSGSKNIYSEDLSSYGADEGVSCAACHSIEETDVKGNADYTITQPVKYVYEMSEGDFTGFLSRFLIRAYPSHHVSSFTRDLYKTPEYCGACHKQFIDEEINKVGWVQLQNQYDNWKSSRWYHEGDPEKTVTCRECHMPLAASTDPAAGDLQDYNRTDDDSKHRSHAFLGANQFIPNVLALPGAEDHTRSIEQWLKGEIDIPEINDKWAQGPSIPVEIIAPEVVTAGEKLPLRVTMLNNKAGHDFPTGPLDIIQAWIDLTVEDQNGNVIFQSGKLDDRNFIQEGSFVLKAEGIDQYGNLIDRHNLWELVGARFKRALFPGFSDVAEYDLVCPSTISFASETTTDPQEFLIDVPANYGGALKVSAHMKYRKVNQFLINMLFGEESKLTAPVTVMSSDTAIVWVEHQQSQ